jgi:alpha-1,3-rhamnosyl/mannosyltransferase
MTPANGHHSPGERTETSGAHTVVLDARMVGPKPVGIGRYVSLLAGALAEMRDTPQGLPYRVVVLVPERDGGYATEAAAGFPRRTVHAPFLHASELVELPRTLRAIASAAPPGARTIYHSPSFSSLFRCPVPWLVTVHDLIHLRFGTRAQKLYYRCLVRPFVRGAATRMTVSQHSREEIARWAGVPRSSVEVVTTGVDPNFARDPRPADVARVLAERGLVADRFFFCLSSPKRHKNVSTLVEAYRVYHRTAAAGSFPALPLVLNVRGYDDDPGVRAVGALSPEELRALLSATAGFFFPSLLEGFGLPPLEAAVAGSPVAVSRIAPLREAMTPLESSEVHWVDPMDVSGWVEALGLAAAGRLPRPSTTSRARAADAFSPRRLAVAMDQVYRRVLGLGPEDSSRP